ncbi:MAG: prepilin peptidase [Spirochaetales bacterium]|nr:prepilin peptidase [Spirochaetales bacterium]
MDIKNIIILSILLLFGIPLIVIDIHKKIIPLFLSIPSIILITAVQFYFNTSLLIITIELFFGFFLFYIIRILTKKGLGLGDAWISALIAVAVGIQGWMVVILIAALSGLVFSLQILHLNFRDKTLKIPFAPFLLAGLYIIMVYKIFSI